MRIGILGGTFNPPHLGHLVCAQEAYLQLQLDRVMLMPARIPPHKPVEDEPGADHRLELCRLAFERDEGRFQVSDLEVRRAGTSYTVDTLEELHSRAPDNELYLIVGADIAAGLPKWRDPERVLSLTLAGVGSGSEPAHIEAFRDSAQRNARDFETLGSPEVAKVYGRSPNRIPFKIKDPRGFAEFVDALSRHDAQGSAHTQRGFQGSRPSLYALEGQIRRLSLPVLIIVGDEDDACIQPSLFLKQQIPASGLAMFPKTGHILNLEEPALFNETLARFLALVEADRWPPRDPASRRA